MKASAEMHRMALTVKGDVALDLALVDRHDHAVEMLLNDISFGLISGRDREGSHHHHSPFGRLPIRLSDQAGTSR